MIINTGMRTDIPAFYSEWLMNRIKDGYVMVRNQYFMYQVTKYSLSPSVVDCLAFCTKNPEPMLKYIDELKKNYKMFWFVTITPYGKDIEPNVPDIDIVIDSFRILSEKIGSNAIALRYDPILLNEEYTIESHIKSFAYILSKLKGYTHDVTISFLDLYDKVKKNAPDIRSLSYEEQAIIAKQFVKIGKENDMIIHGCCEHPALSKFGVDITGCMSKEIVEKAIGVILNNPKGQSKRIVTDSNKGIVEGISLSEKGKPICNCLMGNDIGAYNTCMHLCKYCYANFNKKLVEKNHKMHNPSSPFLIGEATLNDKVTEAKQKSWIVDNNVEQISLFD